MTHWLQWLPVQTTTTKNRNNLGIVQLGQAMRFRRERAGIKSAQEFPPSMKYSTRVAVWNQGNRLLVLVHKNTAVRPNSSTIAPPLAPPDSSL